MRKIGILGGTFDPPHYGHLLIANEVLHRLPLDEVWFMPNHLPPHKERASQISHRDRVEMLELAIRGEARFKIEKIELERAGRSYTYDTMKLLKDREPDAEFYFIIGADMVEYLPKWYNIDELMKLVNFVGVNRPTYRLQSSYPITYLEVPDVKVSSSLIRERLKKGHSVKYLLPDEVINFIKGKGLYGEE